MLCLGHEMPLLAYDRGVLVVQRHVPNGVMVVGIVINSTAPAVHLSGKGGVFWGPFCTVTPSYRVGPPEQLWAVCFAMCSTFPAPPAPPLLGY